MQDYEKLGAFYLGRLFDLEKGLTQEELLLYDSKDLTTHAVCVGMTGSGKTGLGVGLLEEAAIDGIPALVIDPKGDMGNLMLTFPDLKAADFAPWVDPDAAARKGMTAAEFATKTAGIWKKGIGEWGQDPARIQKFKDSAEVTIFTPGSTAGVPLSILRSLTAPPTSLLDDSDALRDRVQTAVSGLLALLGIQADPIQSREHILISNILYQAWLESRDLDLTRLINEIQDPPFVKVGIFDLDSFFPQKERFELAMRLNNLLASPGFSVWMQGEPLEIGRLLYTPQGKPRISILSIAHLSDSERMFFVTVLLNEVIAWMRAQPGTSSLRALLYMDEIFGYFPPTAKPPSKAPMLTLLKQARAYGLGVVLATQNPVDLDYKGLANAGTWFIGRLQTERDKMRVLEGLEGASQSAGHAMDRSRMDKILSALGKRVFLMHNVHEAQPSLFQTRWVLSYLRGPLTRKQIQALMGPRKQVISETESAKSGLTSLVEPRKPQDIKSEAEQKPTLPSHVAQLYVPVDGPLGGSDSIIYRPALLGTTKLHFVSVRAKIDDWLNFNSLASLSGVETAIVWDEAQFFKQALLNLEKMGMEGAKYSTLPEAVAQTSSYTAWKKSLAAYLYQNQILAVWESREFKAFSQMGESEGDFRGRLSHMVHEKRDLEVEKLRKKYAPRLSRLEERLRKSQVRVDKEKSQYTQQKMQTAVSVGATLLGALFGRKVVSTGTIGRATTSMRGVGRAAREKEDIARAHQEALVIQQKLQAMEEEFRAEIEEARADFHPEELELGEIRIRPRKGDLMVGNFTIVWMPWKVGSEGLAEPAFSLKIS